ncbi:MAG: TfoX/Sxy family protein [Caldilineaceae bacterium]
MASDRAFVDYLLELLEPLPTVTAKRMFGGYGLFRQGLMFGLVVDDTLYFKADAVTQADFIARALLPFTYNKQGKVMQMTYYGAPAEVLDESEAMCAWAEQAYGAALRAQQAKRSKKNTKKNTE